MKRQCKKTENRVKEGVILKKIAKIGASIVALAALALSLTGCSSKTCTNCGKKFSSGGTTMNVLGQEVNICPDCMKSVTGGLAG